MIKNTVLDILNGMMVHIMKANYKIINFKERGNINGLKETVMRVISKIIKWMEKEFLNGKMDNITREDLKMIWNKEGVNWSIQTVRN